MRIYRRTAALGLLLVAPAASGEKEKDLRLSLRAAPRVAPAQARVFFTAELKGGADADIYCLTLEWDWGDGTKTSQGGECPAFQPGETPVERIFEAEHEYSKKSRPTVRLRVLQDGRPLAGASVNLAVGPPYQKPTIEVKER